jgi:hypothetical protein
MPIPPNHPAGFAHPWSGPASPPHGFAHFNHGWQWPNGHWWHGNRGRRFGWWWVVGPAWFWYPTVFYTYPGFIPYPNFIPPPELPPGYSYWCDFYLNYYPNVTNCPSGWQVEPPFNGAEP